MQLSTYNPRVKEKAGRSPDGRAAVLPASNEAISIDDTLPQFSLDETFWPGKIIGTSPQNRSLAELIAQISQNARLGPPMSPNQPGLQPGLPYPFPYAYPFSPFFSGDAGRFAPSGDHLPRTQGLPKISPDSQFIGESNGHPKTIAVLPAYNEEVAIGSMVLGARKHVDEVIVVDDGSRDKTAQIAEAAGAMVFRHKENKGKGAALKTGFEAARELGADIIVTLDSDGQHNPDEIPHIIEPVLRSEADMVVGSRYINGKDRNTPFYRRIGQNVLDKVTNLNSGLKVTDTQSGFRAFAAHTMQAFQFKSNGLAIESEMLADAAKAGLRVKEVEIDVRYDVDCSTEHPVSHGLRVLVKVLHDMELNRPLFYFAAPGLVFALVGIAMGLSFLRDFYLGGSLMFGPTLLMILLTLVGSFMAFTGIILHTMSRLLHETKLTKAS